MNYTKGDYIIAMNWFGWKKSRAEIIYNKHMESGTVWMLNHLIYEYNRHKEN